MEASVSEEQSPGDSLRFRDADLPAARTLAQDLGTSVTLAQVLLHRGVSEPKMARDYLEPRLAGLTPPAGMADRQCAAERIVRALRAHERIVVFGDYDVDGTTSASILGGILRMLGGDVRVLIANRFDGGYGFSDPAFEKASALNATLIVTCDCGSSDHERIEKARAAGIDVIVVDHHLVPEEPLPAFAFLNPHRPDCGFPYKGLCSAGLALSVGAAIRSEMQAKIDLRDWLDLVALGTIADVAPLNGDNRRLVRAGLRALSTGRARPGVLALKEAARIKAGVSVGAMDISFRMAPRINAAGRLGDPAIIVDLFEAPDLLRARALAARLEQLNNERRAIEQRITEEAIAQAQELYGDAPKGGIVVAAEGWHRGVVGVVAARLVDRFQAPAVVVAVENGVGHGSARTPEGFSVYDAIARCESSLIRFGGHGAAAGLSVEAARIETFRAGFDDVCRENRLDLPTLTTKPMIDVVIGGDFGLPSAAELALLEPVGEANAEPVFFLPDASVETARVVGEGHLKLGLRCGGRKMSGFGFRMGELAGKLASKVDIYGNLRPDTWRGGDAIELRVAGIVS